MRRAFAGLWSPGGPPAAAGRRLAAALHDEGPAHLLERGSMRVAYSGPELQPASRSPACVLDGTVYELDGARPAPHAVEAALAGPLTLAPDVTLAGLRGDFALVAVDERGESAVVARDHMGGRLAVWSEREGIVAFASEVRLLLRLLERRPEPDPAALAHWLSISGLPGDRTLYAGVRRLEQGGLLALGARPEPRRYWDPRYSHPLPVGAEESAELVREALQTAVHRRCLGGGRGAVLLSGGLDSGSVAALAMQEGDGLAPRRAYSAVFPRHSSVDESALIERVTSQLGLDSTRMVLRSGSVLGGALPYLRRWQVPPVSPNMFFWIPLLRRAADDGVEVMLDGEGGDELFGFSVHLLSDRLRAARLVSMMRLIHRIPSSRRRRPSPSSVMRFVRSYALKGAVPHGLHQAVRRVRGPERYAPAWLRPEMAKAYLDTDDVHSWKQASTPRWFAWLVSRTTQGMGPGMAYDDLRRRAELGGLEARHPLVDVDVLELMLRLPPQHSYSPEHSRPLLRRAVAGLLPDEVRLRSTKSNFNAVFHEALAGHDLAAVQTLLAGPDARVRAYVDPEVLSHMLSQAPARSDELHLWAMRVWRLTTAECWLRAQEGPDELDQLLAPLLTEPDYEMVSAGARLGP